MKKDATTFPRFPFLVAYLNGCIMEIWKDVPGYIGLYKVSNYGRIKSVKKQLVLKTCGSGNRYKTVALCNGMRKTFRVHRLVAAAFIPNPDNNHVSTISTATEPITMRTICVGLHIWKTIIILLRKSD